MFVGRLLGRTLKAPRPRAEAIRQSHHRWCVLRLGWRPPPGAWTHERSGTCG